MAHIYSLTGSGASLKNIPAYQKLNKHKNSKGHRQFPLAGFIPASTAKFNVPFLSADIDHGWLISIYSEF